MASPTIPRYGDTKFEVLAAIVDWWEGVDDKASHAFGPTVEEVRVEVGLSVRSSVQWHINDLLAAGFLTHIPKKHRSLRPTNTGKRLVLVLRENV
jgi:hypothetical protein